MHPKVSLIGTGNWGKILVQKFHNLGGLHLVYGHKNRDVLEPLNLQFTEDIDRLIQESDAVVVATPPQTHLEVGKRVLSAKKDLFLEKPMALSSSEARKLAELAEAHGQIVQVGDILCYSKGFTKLKELPGEIVSAHGTFLKMSTQEKYTNAYWNFGVHMVALAVALNVPPDRFQLDADDEASVNQRTFELQTRTADGQIHKLVWDFLAPENQEDILMIECQHFLDCVKSREMPRTNGKHGVRVLEVLEKIHPEQRRV